MTSFDFYGLITLPARGLMELEFFVAILEWGIGRGMPLSTAALTASFILYSPLFVLSYALKLMEKRVRRREQGGAQ